MAFLVVQSVLPQRQQVRRSARAPVETSAHPTNPLRCANAAAAPIRLSRAEKGVSAQQKMLLVPQYLPTESQLQCEGQSGEYALCQSVQETKINRNISAVQRPTPLIRHSVAITSSVLQATVLSYEEHEASTTVCQLRTLGAWRCQAASGSQRGSSSGARSSSSVAASTPPSSSIP